MYTHEMQPCQTNLFIILQSVCLWLQTTYSSVTAGELAPQRLPYLITLY